MKICFLGAGSLGSTIGGTLAAGGLDVLLVDRDAAHVDAINAHGLTIVTDGTPRVVPVSAATTAAGLGPVDLVVVLVKAFHTREALLAARHLVGPETLVLSLQNGLGNEEVIADVVGAAHVVGGKTYVGGGILGPGRVSAGIAGKTTVLGELDGSVTPRIERVAAAFGRAGLATEISRNIVGMIWDKLLVNVATGAVTTITRLTYGELYRMPALAEIAQQAVAEAVAAADASGIALDTRDPAEVWHRASAGLPDDFKTSMLLGLERGIASEIDYINGAVVRHGERAGVPTPVNRMLAALVKGIERAAGLS